MAGAAQAFGLMVVWSCFYLLLLNVIGVMVSWIQRSSRTPLHLGIASIVFTLLGCLAFLNMGGCQIVVYFIPSMIAACLNLGVWQYRYREAVTPTKFDEIVPKPIAGPAALLTILVATVFLSCLGMRPLTYVIGYVANGRGPAHMQRDDLPVGTTMEELRSRFGEPHDIYFRGTKEERWHYHSDYLAGDCLSIEFDAEGMVSKVREID